MDVFDWIDMAQALGVEGLELYEGFFRSLDAEYLETVGAALQAARFAMPMLCASADFTHPDPRRRQAAVEHQFRMMEVARRLGGAGVACRILTGPERGRSVRRRGRLPAADPADSVRLETATPPHAPHANGKGACYFSLRGWPGREPLAWLA